MATPNLAKVEQRIFRSYWQDGLLDLLAGVSAVLIGGSWLLDMFALSLGIPILAIYCWLWIRRRVTEPRFGHVVFSPKGQHDLKHGLIAIVALGLVVGGNLITRIWLNQQQSSFSEWFAPAIPGVIVVSSSRRCAYRAP